MEGISALIVVSLLAAFCIRWAAVRLRLPMPTRIAVISVFVLVVLTMYGDQLPG